MVEQSSRKVVNVLWTGGYDSSFRMVQLSKIAVDIQPYYLLDGRRSEKHELRAIEAITLDIQRNASTQCVVLPLITYNNSEVTPDNAITKAYNNLKKLVPIGPQYDRLARFAKQYNLQGLELSIEKAASSNVVNIFNNTGAKLDLIDDGNVAYYKLNEYHSNPDLITIFGQYHYPSPLYNMTKLDVLAEYKRLGFEDTIIKTWFCAKPIKDQPCGFCNPCKSTLSEGMSFRFPKSSLRRNKVYKVYGPIRSSVGSTLRKLKLR